jgi:hypothetical protein
MLTSPQLTPRTRFFRQLSPDIVSRSKRLHFLLVVLRKHIKRPCSTNIFLLLSIFHTLLFCFFRPDAFHSHSDSIREFSLRAGATWRPQAILAITFCFQTSGRVIEHHRHRKGCFVMGEQKTTRRNLRREMQNCVKHIKEKKFYSNRHIVPSAMIDLPQFREECEPSQVRQKQRKYTAWKRDISVRGDISRTMRQRYFQQLAVVNEQI